MNLPKATLVALLGATLSVQAQSSEGSLSDLSARSLDSDIDSIDLLSARDAEAEAEAEVEVDDSLADLLYARSAYAEADADADADPELDAELQHLLLTRDLHARVADLEDAVLLAAREPQGQWLSKHSGGGGDSGHKKSSSSSSSSSKQQHNQHWHHPFVPGGAKGPAASFAKGASKAAELATKGPKAAGHKGVTPAMKAHAAAKKSKSKKSSKSKSGKSKSSKHSH